MFIFIMQDITLNISWFTDCDVLLESLQSMSPEDPELTHGPEVVVVVVSSIVVSRVVISVVITTTTTTSNTTSSISIVVVHATSGGAGTIVVSPLDNAIFVSVLIGKSR